MYIVQLLRFGQLCPKDTQPLPVCRCGFRVQDDAGITQGAADRVAFDFCALRLRGGPDQIEDVNILAGMP